jgi:hypothetical protein
MTFTLAALRDDVESDLRDDGNAVWSTGQIDRAIALALAEYSAVAPRVADATLTVSGRSADLSAAAPGGLGSAFASLVRVLAVEYPDGLYPPAYPRWHTVGPVLHIHADAPLAAETVRVTTLHQHVLHASDAAQSTVPDASRALIAMGAAGHALRQRAATLAADALAIGGSDATRRLSALGDERLARFHDGLRRLRRLRSSSLYRPADAGRGRDIVDFPNH